ncbi:MAG: polyhydroxyalkanoate synthase [Candidatus Azotimanducaceae bacterium]|jgi:polyhydroxyalkanoate synthase
MAEQAVDNKLMDQMRSMVDKTIQRSIKGVQFVNSGKASVGLTPKDVVYDRGTLQLYHYHPRSDEIYRIPIILVMATTNRGYVFDLLPGQSLVEYLLDHGFDVFMIDWDTPMSSERGLSLADYTQDFLPSCIEKVQEITGEEDVNMVSYCMGGVLSLIYASTHLNGPLKNLVCMTTPVNWHEMGLMKHWSDERYLDVDKLVDTLGIVPAEFIEQSFEMLRPAQKTAGRLRVWNEMWNDDFVRSYRAFERWGSETLPLAGEYYRETTRELMWANKLFEGNLVIDGMSANLADIKIPIMNAIAEHDHIAPYKATKPLLEKVGSEDTHEIVLKGGHVSLIAGPNAVRRLWPEIDRWLSERSV